MADMLTALNALRKNKSDDQAVYDVLAAMAARIVELEARVVELEAEFLPDPEDTSLSLGTPKSAYERKMISINYALKELATYGARLDALEATQQPAPVPVKPTGPLDAPAYPDRMSDVILNPTVGEFKPIPVKDYEAALVILTAVRSTVKVSSEWPTLVQHVDEAIRLLTAPGQPYGKPFDPNAQTTVPF